MKKIFTAALILFLVAPDCLAQAPQIQWQKVLGREYGDYPFKILNTTDGGYIVAGYREATITTIPNSNNFYMDQFLWVIKLNGLGEVEWENHVASDITYDVDLLPATDGGYLAVATAWKPECTGEYDLDFHAVKFSAVGEVEWKKWYGGSKHEYVHSATVSSDNNYILAGHTESNDGDVSGNHGGRDYWVIKIDQQGTLLWQKTLGGSLDEEAYGVAAAHDGGCLVTGRTYSNNQDVTGYHGNTDAWTVRLSGNGDIQWKRSLGGSMFETGNAVTSVPGGGFIVAAQANSEDGDVTGLHNVNGAASDYWLVNLSATGNIIWSRCYGGRFNETPYAIKPVPDGGYIVFGSAESPDGDLTCNKGISDAWLLRINATGTLLWQKSFGGSYYDEGFSVLPLADKSFILAAQTCSPDIAGHHAHPPEHNLGTCSDFLVIKLAPEGTADKPPMVKIDPATTKVCGSQPATLYAKAFNIGANTVYRWERNGVPVGESSPYYTSTLQAGDLIRCTITSEGSCDNLNVTATDVVTLTTNNNTIQPEISITASSDMLCDCQEVKFEAAVKNIASSPVFKWKINSKELWTNRSSIITNKLKPGDVVTCEYADASICINNGKVVSNTVTMKANSGGAPAVTISMPGDVVCTGTRVRIKAAAVNAGPRPTYLWTINGSPAGFNADSLVLDSPVDGDRIKCSIVTDPSYTCSNSNTATSGDLILRVKDRTIPSVTLNTASPEICEREQAIVTTNVTGAGAKPSYQWMLNGSGTGETSPVFRSTALKNNDEIYAIVTPGDDVCDVTPVSSGNIKFVVHEAPVVMISPADTIVKRGAQVQLKATINGDYHSFNWMPQERLSMAGSLQPTTMPLRESTEFWIEVINEAGCRVKANAKLHIRSALYMANAFTPNADGRNDVFRIPEGTSIQLSEFAVFDRWGNKLFSTKDITKGWTGLVNGKAADSGLYVYLVSGENEKGKFVDKGTVLLIR